MLFTYLQNNNSHPSKTVNKIGTPVKKKNIIIAKDIKKDYLGYFIFPHSFSYYFY